MITLNYQSGMPIYQQIKNKILEEIMLGILKADEQLPTVRTLARELGINPNTIQKAYQELEGEGVIYSLTGKGSFIQNVGVAGQKILKERLEAVTKALEEAKMAGATRPEIDTLVTAVYDKGGNAK